MLIDRLKIKIKSGDGGEGLISFDNRGKAYGGDGGIGGSVIIKGDANIYDFSKFDPNSTYKAEDGDKGQTYCKHGKDGEPAVLQVPLVTRVFNMDGEQIGIIENHGDEIELLKGGEGGLGNFTLRGNGWDGKLSRKRASSGSEMDIRLELNLKADVILLGYPNAGKSSLINALTRARSKVASYEFTTLEPQLGVMDGYIKLMDLPGLIEGTHTGKGVGTKFLKHTMYSKILLHCLSIEDLDLKARYLSMREEFKNISPTLGDMPEIIVLTKADVIPMDMAEEIRKELEEQIQKKVVLISSYLPETLEQLKDDIKQMLDSQKN